MSNLFSFVRLSLAGAALSLMLAGCGGGGQSALPSQTLSTQSDVSTAVSRSPGLDAIPAPAATTAALPSYAGCTIFASGDYYNKDVTHDNVDPHSADYLASIEAVDNTGFSASTGLEPVNIADDATPVYTVHPRVSYHVTTTKYPWQNGFEIEDATDGHFVAINKQTCHLYESYETTFGSGIFTAYSAKDYNLHNRFVIGAGVMASGLSYFAGAIRHQEIATGIHHALNLNVWYQSLCNCFIKPAGSTDDLAYSGRASAYEMPYGAQLRLKISYNCSTWGPQSAAICAALKHYGAYIADTDGHFVDNNEFFFVNPDDGGSWNGSDLAALSNLRFSDFQVLTNNP